MLNLVIKSLPVRPFAIPTHAATSKRTSRLQFLVREMRTFCAVLDELKRAQLAQARYETLPHWTATSAHRVREEFYSGR